MSNVWFLGSSVNSVDRDSSGDNSYIFLFVMDNRNGLHLSSSLSRRVLNTKQVNTWKIRQTLTLNRIKTGARMCAISKFLCSHIHPLLSFSKFFMFTYSSLAFLSWMIKLSHCLGRSPVSYGLIKLSPQIREEVQDGEGKRGVTLGRRCHYHQYNYPSHYLLARRYRVVA